MFDLFRPKPTACTVLESMDGWTNNEISNLSVRLKPMTSVSAHPKHPTLIIIAGKISRAQVDAILPAKHCEIRVTDTADKELPWKPNFI